MANKLIGLGVTLKRGDGGSPEAFTAIPSISTLDGPKMDSEMLDATTLDSAGGFEELLQGMRKAGTLTFDLLFDPGDAEHKGLLDDWKNKVLRNFEILWSDSPATQYSFAAFVKSFAPKASPKAIVTMAVELQISGAPTMVTT